MNVRQYRRSWLEKHFPVQKGTTLEFGAFDYPTYSKNETAIEYLDYCSKQELAEIHTKAKPERVKNAIEVDYVIKQVDFAEHLPKRFDLLIANHVIEHVPDLVRWFSNASKLLNAASGRIFLSIPHKEYTFDKIRPITTLSDLLLAYESKLVAPSVQQLFESLYYYRPVRAEHLWGAEAEYEQLIKSRRYTSAKVAWELAKNKLQGKDFLDLHCTVFTYESFLDLMGELERGGYTQLKVIHSMDVQRLSNEFHVLLG
jgi:hypothetical protein